jgi:hypothetical protein
VEQTFYIPAHLRALTHWLISKRAVAAPGNDKPASHRHKTAEIDIFEASIDPIWLIA